MTSFIHIELLSALNEHKCIIFRESKQGIDDHIRYSYGDFYLYLQFYNFTSDVNPLMEYIAINCDTIELFI